MTPITRSPTFKGAQMSAFIDVWSVMRRGSLSTSLTSSPLPLSATAPTMPRPSRNP